MSKELQNMTLRTVIFALLVAVIFVCAGLLSGPAFAAQKTVSGQVKASYLVQQGVDTLALIDDTELVMDQELQLKRIILDDDFPYREEPTDPLHTLTIRGDGKLSVIGDQSGGYLIELYEVSLVLDGVKMYVENTHQRTSPHEYFGGIKLDYADMSLKNGANLEVAAGSGLGIQIDGEYEDIVNTLKINDSALTIRGDDYSTAIYTVGMPINITNSELNIKTGMGFEMEGGDLTVLDSHVRAETHEEGGDGINTEQFVCRNSSILTSAINASGKGSCVEDSRIEANSIDFDEYTESPEPAVISGSEILIRGEEFSGGISAYGASLEILNSRVDIADTQYGIMTYSNGAGGNVTIDDSRIYIRCEEGINLDGEGSLHITGDSVAYIESVGGSYGDAVAVSSKGEILIDEPLHIFLPAHGTVGEMAVGQSYYKNTITDQDGKPAAKALIKSADTEDAEENLVEATCTKAGSYDVVTYCRYEKQDGTTCSAVISSETKEIPAKGHDWEDSYTVEHEPTCTVEGSKSIHCKNCEATRNTEAIPAVGHTWGEWTEVVSPKCTDAGSEKRACTVCQSEETRGVDPKGHDWEEDYTVDKAASCTADGSKSIHCKNCDVTRNSEAIPGGHQWADDFTVDKEPTCTEAGSKSVHCTVCDQKKYVVTIPAAGHAWGAWEKLNDAQHQRVCEADASHMEKADHRWDSGKVTKDPSIGQAGEKTFTCYDCQATRAEEIPALDPGNITPVIPTEPDQPTPDQPDTDRSQQMGADGTALGPGASAEAAEAFITSANMDSDPAGSVFLPLQLKSVKQTKTSLKVQWKKVSGAKKYMIFGNKCGTKNKMKKLTTVTKTNFNVKKAAGKKVKKGKYYKFVVVALDENNNVVATSKVVHAVTKGSKKFGNHKSIILKAKQGKKVKTVKTASLNTGKKLTLKAKQVPASKKLKVAKHTKVRYESTNAAIASVSKKGVVTAKSPGTCKIYAYAQNGVSKIVTITVK